MLKLLSTWLEGTADGPNLIEIIFCLIGSRLANPSITNSTSFENPAQGKKSYFFIRAKKLESELIASGVLVRNASRCKIP